VSDNQERPPLPDWAEELLPKAKTDEPESGTRVAQTQLASAQIESDVPVPHQDEPGTRTGAIPIMDRVESSNIQAVGHDGSALYVRFVGGALYRYRTAGADLHAALLASASPGKFFHRKIRDVHQGERVS
jgi:KTSC domain